MKALSLIGSFLCSYGLHCRWIQRMKMMSREWFLFELPLAWPFLASFFFSALSPLILAVGVVLSMPLLFSQSAIKGTTI